MDPDQQETVDYVALRRLQNAYADIVTRRAWAELDDVFLADATIKVDRGPTATLVEVVGPRALGEFISKAVDRFEFFQFLILNTRVWLRHDGDDDLATGRMYMSELRQDKRSGRWDTIYGVYQDRYQRQRGQWRFAERMFHAVAWQPSDFLVAGFPTFDG